MKRTPISRGCAERSLILLKPDCMERCLVGAVLNRFQKVGLQLVACKMLLLTPSLLRAHYAHLVGESFYTRIETFMSSRPVIVAILEGDAAVDSARTLLGPTDPTDAGKGTIRGDWGTDKMRNLCHASDSPESAAVEIQRFFKPTEIFNTVSR